MPKYKAITALIEEAMEREQQEKKKYTRDPKVFWPSSSSVKYTNEYGEEEVIGKCLRQEYWSIVDEPPTNKTNARSVRIWDYGNNVEALELKGAKLAGIHKDEATPFVHTFGNNLKVRGRLDGIYNIDGESVGVEYKSGYGSWFRRNQLGLGYDGRLMRSDPGAPRDSNILQTLLYLDHFKGKIDTFVIIYLDRGDGAWREFPIQIDDAGHPVVEGKVDKRFSVKDIYSRFEELQGYLERKEVPPPDFEPFYTNERVDALLERGSLTKKAYDLHQKWIQKKSRGKRAGYFLCNGYCPYENKCKKKIAKDAKNEGAREVNS